MDHGFSFDPTYGYDREALLRVGCPPAPEDFAEFWRETYAAARSIAPRVTRRAVDVAPRDREVFEIEFDSFDGVRIGGWLTLPKGGVARHGFVVGHGYGGREGPDGWLPLDDAAAIFPCARGFHRSARADIPNSSDRHVLHGIESRETYVHRGCAADAWCAASALLDVVPDVEGHLDYMGASFGGGIGALAVAWEERFRKAYLDVPSFGNHPIRLRCPCVGSGESVRKYSAEHPEVRSVLEYFDSAVAARRIRIPTLVAAAVFDPAVPPPGQFAVHNALGGPKELFVRQAAHFDFPGAAGENLRLARVLMKWFAEG